MKTASATTEAMAASTSGPPRENKPILAADIPLPSPRKRSTFSKRAAIANCAPRSISAGPPSPRRNGPDHLAAPLLFPQGKRADATNLRPIAAPITTLPVPMAMPIVRQTRETMPTVRPSLTPGKLGATRSPLLPAPAIPGWTRNTSNSNRSSITTRTSSSRSYSKNRSKSTSAWPSKIPMKPESNRSSSATSNRRSSSSSAMSNNSSRCSRNNSHRRNRRHSVSPRASPTVPNSFETDAHSRAYLQHIVHAIEVADLPIGHFPFWVGCFRLSGREKAGSTPGLPGGWATARVVLVQPEMESKLARLPAILLGGPFSAGQLGEHRPMQWRLVEQAAAETGRPVPLSDSLRSVAGAARRPALFPQLFPIPDPGCHLDRQRESELMREHTHLPAMVGFVRKHVAQHFRPNRPRPTPAVPAKLLDAAPRTAERFSEHLLAASGALGQSRTGLLRRAVRAVELSWNLQVRSCKPDPLGADIVHVREDRRNGAGLARRFGSPGCRVKMFDKNLVHAIIGAKELDGGSAQLRVNLLSVNLRLTRGHGSLLLDL